MKTAIATIALAGAASAMPTEKGCRFAGMHIGDTLALKEHKVDIFLESLKKNITATGLVPANRVTGEISSISCDICTFALQKAYSYGCGAASDALSAICLDFAPVCAAAFNVLCSVANADLNLACWTQWACAHVDLCPSTTCATAPMTAVEAVDPAVTSVEEVAGAIHMPLPKPHRRNPMAKKAVQQQE